MVLAAIGLAIVAFTGAGRGDFSTEFDRSGGTRTSSYAETIDDLARLDRASKWIKVVTFGTSGEGRALPLAIVDRRGHFTPEAVRRDGKVLPCGIFGRWESTV